LEIIKKLSDENPNVSSILLPENMGVGNARNEGMLHAHGELVNFLDSDDWLDSNFYSSMIRSVEEYSADIAIAGVKNEWDNVNSSQTRYRYTERNLINSRYALSLLSRSVNNCAFISPMVGGKIFKASFIKNHKLKFDKRSYNEDDIFTFMSLLYSDKIVIVPDVYQHYYQHEHSISHSFSKKHIDDLIDAFAFIKHTLVEKEMYAAYVFEYRAFFENCITSVLSMLFRAEKQTQLQKEYIKYFAKQFFKAFSMDECIDYLDVQRIRRFFDPPSDRGTGFC
jgi:glycosyltransferase involved in cell wall biosynthesis